MKVTVKDKFLNVRVGQPSVNAECNQFIAPGSEIEVDGQLHKGDLFNGIDTWLKDGAGNFYWSGGVETSQAIADPSGVGFQDFLSENFDGTNLSSTINYNSLLAINPQLKTNAGAGVTVVILDHPISLEMPSVFPIQRLFNIGSPLKNFHANFIFGIIAGAKNIVGIASQVRVISLPIFNEKGFSLPNGVENALNFIRDSPDPMIINISNGFDKNFDEILNGFSSNKIIVSCAGVNEELAANPIRYPASFANAIPVGAIDSSFTGTGINQHVKFLLPNFNYTSFNNPTSFRSNRGDSFSTAVVSATIALLISSGVVGFDTKAIIQALQSNAAALTNIAAQSSLNLLNV